MKKLIEKSILTIFCFCIIHTYIEFFELLYKYVHSISNNFKSDIDLNMI